MMLVPRGALAARVTAVAMMVGVLAAGPGVASASSVQAAAPARAAAAVATVPDAPTAVTATAGSNGTASVAFTAPADGGSPITGYTATSTPGSITMSGSSSPIAITGLTNGVSYTFTVHATNATGDSAESAPSNAVTPTAAKTAPGAPTAVSATPGNSRAVVSFTAPASNGGDAITGYTVQPYAGGAATGSPTTGSSSPITVAGLINGTAYTFTVTATNSTGTGPASAASTAVTPAATPPGAPTGVTAQGGDTDALVTFTAPANNGGSAITGYTVTSTPGGRTATGTKSPIVVSGLTNRVAYTFTVHATNSVGNSPESAPSNSVIPVASYVSVPSYRSGHTFVIRSGITANEATDSVVFGATGDLPLWGDWNGDSNKSPGVYRPSNRTFYLAADDGSTVFKQVTLGQAGDLPVSGDVNNDGIDSIGVYRPSSSTFFLTNNDRTVISATHFGTRGDKPIIGDWDGSGRSQIGVYRPSTSDFYEQGFGAGHFGRPGDAPVVGDWDGDGVTNVGVVRGTTWYVANPTDTGSEAPFTFGASGATYLAFAF